MSFVPFISSGASSRLHYVLVRRVESAPSPESVDDIISAEMRSIVEKFTEGKVSSKVCEEYLKIILYCITVSTVLLPALHSILPHAVNLAEAGSSISEKRMGYLFCAEVMPTGHELQLMLVNTLRKDLESQNLANISLALNHLIQCPSEDVIPAIQSRLRNLLVHNSPQIRRRALLAVKVLSTFDSDLLSGSPHDIIERIWDSDETVCNAALLTASKLCQVYTPILPEVRDTVNALFCETWAKHHNTRRSVLIRSLDALRTMGHVEFDIPLLSEVIRRAARQNDYALIRSAFLYLAPLHAGLLTASSSSVPVAPVAYVRSMLTSRESNQQYLFLTCLECLDPQLWAGTTPEIPAVLEQREVEHIMKFLDHHDSVLRKKTIVILNRVDPNIISSYYGATLQNILNRLGDEKVKLALPLFEVLEVQAGMDGERYARDVLTLLRQIEAPSSTDGHIFEHVIDIILSFVRQSSGEFMRSTSNCLLTSLLDTKVQLGSTTMVIMAALACENSGQLSVSWIRILEALSFRIAFCPIPVQDACLLSMLRIAADCSEVSSQVLAAVSKLKEVSGRHIKRRCEQFIQTSSDKKLLHQIADTARSSTLPDFLEALQNHQARKNPRSSSSSPSPRSPQGRSRASEPLSASKLRYSAYDAPVPTLRLQGRTSSNSNYDSESSALGFPRGFTSTELSNGGELTLMASTREFESEMSASINSDELPNTISNPNDATTRIDLIAFDSPFVPDPSESSQMSGPFASEMSFGDVWEGSDAEARGWYGKSIDQLLRRIQIMDPSNVDLCVIDTLLPPFLGELKVMVRFKAHTSMTSCAVLRLKESEEESCLWKLRGDLPLYAMVKNILTED
ncbi:armadillo-type protein [Lentinula aff. lateritia]|uniref:Armadillo-type protein n=1 Tax=Lentinula aff. lateritia TaxID=2804960 RepID=A0ACC1U046_9AGAR|nr:armadillo-type protein [Lentinula aff. lateritia]